MFAPIPPVPFPLAQPVLKPDPETERRLRVQVFIEHPEFLSLFREAVRRFQALPPKTLPPRTRKPRKDQRVRVRVRVRVRSNEQVAKRLMQRLQHKSYIRTYARP